MKAVPVVQQCRPDPSNAWRHAADRMVRTLRDELPHLALSGQFRDLFVTCIDDAPTLVLDDLSEISRINHGQDIRFYQDRARLRAADGDLVASCGDRIPQYENYCCDFLGLGSPEWVRPTLPHLPLRIAEACWEDPHVRNRLLERLRRGELRYVHPHMGTFSVWELALLLHCEARRPLSVIAPPPQVTRWVGDKLAFANLVTRLFGRRFVPKTESASNLAYITKRVSDLAVECEVIGLKLPDSAGGEGNLVIDAQQFRGQPLLAIRQALGTLLQQIAWDGASPILIDRWETNVVCSPSVQSWIPPLAEGPPVMEGVFVQSTEGLQGCFVGSVPANLPRDLDREIVDRCWLLAWLFQQFGYVGRCSFDLILVGASPDDCRIEFVECNGRWGGTSLPMTLMNRIFGDWVQRPYAVQVVHHLDGLDQLTFAQILECFESELFDVRTGKGSLIFINPGRLKYQSGITVLALADNWESASEAASRMPSRLLHLARQSTDACS